jgi:DNA primase
MSNPNAIEDFIEKIPIEDVVNKFIKLRKISRLFWGPCPFHTENTPSFVVNTDKRFFYCFGCGVGGNVINFLMKIKNQNFIETVSELSNHYHIPYNIPQNIVTSYHHKQEYEKKIIEFFSNYIKICHQKLMIHDEALKYLSQRGVFLDVIRSFSLGYDDGAVNDLIDLGYSISEIQEYGILSNEDWSSKFKQRIILPVTNTNGDYISVTGRTLSANKNVVKYLHSIENSIFYKKTTFFNYHNMGNYESVYIVEGFFDMLSCIHNGINNVVSCLGASISDEQIFILQKKFKTIHLLLDGDVAGLQGMIKAAYKFLGYYGNTRVNFYILPSMDPADYLMENSLDNLPCYNLEDFLWEYHIKGNETIIDGTTITKIYKKIDEITEFLKKNEDINEKVLNLLIKYWNKKIYDFSGTFYRNSKKSQQFLPIVTHKSHLLIITLFHKIHEVMDNMDQLSKIYIQENKLTSMFNKIINLVFDNEHENQQQLQQILKDNFNGEELMLLNNMPLNSIVSWDTRSLQKILDDEFMVQE